MQHAIDSQASDFMMPGCYENRWGNGLATRGRTRTDKGHPVAHRPLLEISTQLLCVTPTAHWLEYADWWNPIMSEPLQIKSGFALVGGATGTGVAWDEKVVERFSV